MSFDANGVLQIDRGINLRELERIWVSLGGFVQQRRRTGENRLIHAALGLRSNFYNNRRKDAPFALVHWVRKALAEPKPPSVDSSPILEPTRPLLMPLPPVVWVEPEPEPDMPIHDTAAADVQNRLTRAAVVDALELELRRRGFNGDAPAKAEQWFDLVTVRADGSSDVAEVAEMARRDKLRDAEKAKAPKPVPPPPVVELVAPSKPVPATISAPAQKTKLISGPDAMTLMQMDGTAMSKLRRKGTGPSWQQVGRFFFYDEAEVLAWVAAHPKAPAPVAAAAPRIPTLVELLTEYVDTHADGDARHLAVVLMRLLQTEAK